MNQWTSSGLREEVGKSRCQGRWNCGHPVMMEFGVFCLCSFRRTTRQAHRSMKVENVSPQQRSTQKNFNIGGSASIFGILGGNSGLHLDVYRSWLPESGCCTSNMKINVILVHQ